MSLDIDLNLNRTLINDINNLTTIQKQLIITKK